MCARSGMCLDGSFVPLVFRLFQVYTTHFSLIKFNLAQDRIRCLHESFQSD